MPPLETDLLADAKRAVSENLRHSHDSLFCLLCNWHPDATDEQIEAAVKAALG